MTVLRGDRSRLDEADLSASSVENLLPRSSDRVFARLAIGIGAEGNGDLDHRGVEDGTQRAALVVVAELNDDVVHLLLPFSASITWSKRS